MSQFRCGRRRCIYLSDLQCEFSTLRFCNSTEIRTLHRRPRASKPGILEITCFFESRRVVSVELDPGQLEYGNLHFRLYNTRIISSTSQCEQQHRSRLEHSTAIHSNCCLPTTLESNDSGQGISLTSSFYGTNRDWSA